MPWTVPSTVSPRPWARLRPGQPYRGVGALPFISQTQRSRTQVRLGRRSPVPMSLVSRLSSAPSHTASVSVLTELDLVAGAVARASAAKDGAGQTSRSLCSPTEGIA